MLLLTAAAAAVQCAVSYDVGAVCTLFFFFFTVPVVNFHERVSVRKMSVLSDVACMANLTTSALSTVQGSFWDKQECTIDGMLGGYGDILIDV